MKNIIIIACCRSGHNFVMDQIRSWGDYNIVNFEDMLPAVYQKHLNYLDGSLVDISLEVIPIIIVRDLLNWWASYMTWIFNKPVPKENIQNMFNIWVTQVKEAAKVTNYIPGAVDINYDSFKSSVFTRKALCDTIGGEYSEKVLNEIPTPGNGSSFDVGVPGQAMEAGLRYKQAIGGGQSGYYVHILSQNQEALELYKKHFHLTDDQKQLCKGLS